MSRIPVMMPDKDPGESRAYAIDWSDHLGSATISTSTWTVIQGTVTAASESETTTVATVVLSGGAIGDTSEIMNSITTSAGETLRQSIRVRVRKN